MPARLADVLTESGITAPTPIQLATLPDSLAGRDVLGRGRTGSGKTLAFVLPVLTRLSGGTRASSGAPRALILAPTRELVAQIDAVLQPLAAAAGITTRTVFGGVGQNPQVAALRRGVDVLVACPGRLEDLIAQGHCSLTQVEVTVLDEADHMADLGFLPAVRRLLDQTPKGGQRLLFSATLDRAVDALVRRFLSRPVTHEADSDRSPVIEMSHHVLEVQRDMRLSVLLALASAPGRTVVFTRTKHAAKALTRQLNTHGVLSVELHGNLGQNARNRNLEDFRSGRVSTLVATDIAARGIHVDDIMLVIHADPPTDHKAYLHRSGRTARAGNTGTVVTLTTGEQMREVRQLTLAAGISPQTTRVSSADDPVLVTLAPGIRARRVTAVAVEPQAPAQRDGSSPHRPERPTRSAGRSRPSTGSGGTSTRSATGRRRPPRSSAAAVAVAEPSRSRPAAGTAGHSAADFSARRR